MTRIPKLRPTAFCEPQFQIAVVDYTPVDPPSDPKVRNEAKKLIRSAMLAKSTDIFHSY